MEPIHLDHWLEIYMGCIVPLCQKSRKKLMAGRVSSRLMLDVASDILVHGIAPKWHPLSDSGTEQEITKGFRGNFRISFLMSPKLCCDYSVQSPQWGISTECSQHMFLYVHVIGKNYPWILSLLPLVMKTT